jgi:hypothetical protein
MIGTRPFFMALGALSLLGALAGGLARLGWALPTTAPLVAFHGPLMVAGFFGTVIGLERAVALGRPWAHAAPAATVLGAIALATGLPGGAWLMLLGSAVTMLVAVEIARIELAPFSIVPTLGAGSWLVAQVLWVAGWPMHHVVYWWMGFFVFTVVGERLDLTRVVHLDAKTRAACLGGIVVLLVGIILTLAAPDLGFRIAGAAMVAVAVWLGVFDLARRSVRASGMARFTALALLSGYAWLGVTGLLALRFGGVAAGFEHDAILHALFVGFVFSMVFGHGPTTFPDLLSVGVAYRPALYGPLGLLHASLVLRLVGDCATWLPGRRWGGLGNAVAIVLFFAIMAQGIAASRPRIPSSRAEGATPPSPASLLERS